MSELQAERMVTDEDSIVFNFDLWAYSFYLVSNLTYSAVGHLYLVIGFDLAMQGSIRLYLVLEDKLSHRKARYCWIRISFHSYNLTERHCYIRSIMPLGIEDSGPL